MKIIDPHVHLFDIAQGDYHWLKPDNSPFWSDKALINKTCVEGDLAFIFETDLKSEPVFSSELELVLASFVHIEAGFDNKRPWRELNNLEATCKKTFSCNSRY